MSHARAEHYHFHDKSFTAGYRVFEPRTDLWQRIAERIDAELSSHMPLRQPAIRVLDIGCGDGLMTSRCLAAFKKLSPQATISLDLVEPSRPALHEAVGQVTADHPAIRVTVHEGTAEQFLASPAAAKTACDWIIASQVFYHVPVASLGPLLSRLRNHGVAMVAMVAHQHPLRELAELDRYYTLGDSEKVLAALRGEELSKAYSFSLSKVPTRLNLSGLLDNAGNLLPDGQLLFSFFYQRNFRDYAESEKKSLLDAAKSYVAEHAGIVPYEHHLIWVHRR